VCLFDKTPQDRIAKHQSVCRDTPRKRLSSKPAYDPTSAAKNGAHRSPMHRYRARSETKHIESSAGTRVATTPSYNAQPLQLVNSSRSYPTAFMSQSYRSTSVFDQPSYRNSSNARDREKPRFDIVLRDATMRQSLTGATGFGASTVSSGGWSARTLNLVASNASSSSNPLATSRFMTMASIH
jgi:hypothetical protein